jgi:hypothetical protein
VGGDFERYTVQECTPQRCRDSKRRRSSRTAEHGSREIREMRFVRHRAQHFPAGGVLRPVEFNDNLRTMAGEIRNVLSDRSLASNVKAVTFASPQCAPHQTLRLGGCLSQLAHASDSHCRVAIRSGGQWSNCLRSKWQLLVQRAVPRSPTRPPSRMCAPECDLPARGRWGMGLWIST